MRKLGVCSHAQSKAEDVLNNEDILIGLKTNMEKTRNVVKCLKYMGRNGKRKESLVEDTKIVQ